MWKSGKYLIGIAVLLIFVSFFYGGCQKNISSLPPEKPDNQEKQAEVNSRFDEILGKVNDLIYKDKKYEEALNVINNELSREASDDRQTAMVMFRRAEILSVYGKYNESEDLLRKSLNIDISKDQRVYAYSTIAVLCISSNRKQEALAYMNKANKIVSKLGSGYFGEYEFYYSYGTVLCDKGEYPESIKYLNKALTMKPDSESLMIELSFAYLRNNQPAEARKLAQKWMDFINRNKALPKDKEEILDRVEDMVKYYIVMGEYDKALEIIREADSIKSDDCSNDMELFYVYYYSGQYDKMEEVFERIMISEHSDKWEKDIAGGLLKEVRAGKNKTK